VQQTCVIFPGVFAIVGPNSSALYGRRKHLDFLSKMLGVTENPFGVFPGEVSKRSFLPNHYRQRPRDICVASFEDVWINAFAAQVGLDQFLARHLEKLKVVAGRDILGVFKV
jgi:hypothetical protein